MMAADERSPIQDVIAQLRSHPVDFAGDLAAVRAQFDSLGRQPSGEAARRMLDRVPVIELPGDTERGIVVFAHAGGYVAGSASNTRH